MKDLEGDSLGKIQGLNDPEEEGLQIQIPFSQTEKVVHIYLESEAIFASLLCLQLAIINIACLMRPQHIDSLELTNRRRKMFQSFKFQNLIFHKDARKRNAERIRG